MKGHWAHINTNAQALTVVLNSNDTPDDNYTLILSVCISYGTVGTDQKIEQVADAGSGKIISAV